MDELVERAARDLARSKHAIALTGAGMSTESGIPDFRGPDGIWTKDPEAERKAYEAYDLFRRDPRRFWEERLDPNGAVRRLFEKLGEMDKVRPNPGHHALAEMERMGVLKCILTQNVDGLHQKAGSLEVVEYHGGINKFRCIKCGRRITADELDLDGLATEGALPPYCECGGIIKDDGVYFGEPIPEDVRARSEEEALKCDAMLICGTSAVVHPFADLPRLARFGTRRSHFGLPVVGTSKRSVVIIEVNAAPTPLTETISDYIIRGRTGEVLPEIVERIGQNR